MNFSTENEFLRNIKCTDSYTESAAEYSLPDYLGDVRKILYTSAVARPAGKFAGGEDIEHSGIVEYEVVYLDAENNISSVEFTSDYDYAVKYCADKYKSAISDTRVHNYVIRLVGPRKISAKVTLVGCVRICERDSVSVSGTAFEEGRAVEALTESVRIRRCGESGVIEREYAEMVCRLDGAIADEVSVVHSRVDVDAESVEAHDGYVGIKGKIKLCAVVKNGESPAYLSEKSVAFEESIPFGELDEEMRLFPSIAVVSRKAAVNPDENGCEVVLSGIVEFAVRQEGNSSLEVVRDAYLCDCNTENTYDNFGYTELVGAMSKRVVHQAEIARSEIDAGDMREIIFITATPKIESVTVEGCGVHIKGEMKYSGVASEVKDGGDMSYTMIKFSTSIDENVNLDCQNDEKMQFETDAVVHDVDATLDANKLYVSTSMDFTIILSADKEVSILSSAQALDDEPAGSVGSCISVYYPTESDTLFSVAKRFHTTVAKLCDDNSLSVETAATNSSEKLRGIKKLLIF